MRLSVWLSSSAVGLVMAGVAQMAFKRDDGLPGIEFEVEGLGLGYRVSGFMG